MTSPETLPIISLATFLPDSDPNSSPTPEQLETAWKLDKACTDYGFFYLSDHGVPQELLDRVIDIGGRFFTENGLDEKEKIKIIPAGVLEGDGARGYQMIGENVTKGLKVSGLLAECSPQRETECYAPLNRTGMR